MQNLLFGIRCQFRLLIVLTSGGPLGHLYRALYQGCIWLVKSRLRRLQGFRALYLRRGLAKGDLVPGVSDIDLTLITDGDQVEAQLVYQTFSRLIPFLESEIHILSSSGFSQTQEQPHHRLRMLEAKKTWKLLAGKDFLWMIPDWRVPQLYEALYREIKIWFRLFLAYLVLDQRLRKDRVFVNSFCYKFLLELLKLERAWFQDHLVFSRKEMATVEHPWQARLHELKSSRFTHRGEVLEWTWREALGWLDRFSEQLLRHPFSAHHKPLKRDRSADDVLFLSDSLRVSVWSCSQRPGLAEVRAATEREKNLYLRGPAWALALFPQKGSSTVLTTATENPEFFPQLDRLPGLNPFFQNQLRRRATLYHRLTLEQESFWASVQGLTALSHAQQSLLVVLDKEEELRKACLELFEPVPEDIINDGRPYLKRFWNTVKERAAE